MFLVFVTYKQKTDFVAVAGRDSNFGDIDFADNILQYCHVSFYEWIAQMFTTEGCQTVRDSTLELKDIKMSTLILSDLCRADMNIILT